MDLAGVVTFAYTRSVYNRRARYREKRRILVITLTDGRVAKWTTRSNDAFTYTQGDRVHIRHAHVAGYSVFKGQPQILLRAVRLNRAADPHPL